MDTVLVVLTGFAILVAYVILGFYLFKCMTKLGCFALALIEADKEIRKKEKK